MSRSSDPKLLELAFDVAGVTLNGRQSIVKKLFRTQPIYLIREPDNAADSNAIAVYVEDVHVRRRYHSLGYVPREVAKVIAPLIDGGATFVAYVSKPHSFMGDDGQPVHMAEMNLSQTGFSRSQVAQLEQASNQASIHLAMTIADPSDRPAGYSTILPSSAIQLIPNSIEQQLRLVGQFVAVVVCTVLIIISMFKVFAPIPSQKSVTSFNSSQLQVDGETVILRNHVIEGVPVIVAISQDDLAQVTTTYAFDPSAIARLTEEGRVWVVGDGSPAVVLQTTGDLSLIRTGSSGDPQLQKTGWVSSKCVSRK